jgi:eukaryotic-like serine/threonine-protein kinase
VTKLPANWKRVREIVAAFVAEICAADHELRSEVEAILAAEAASTELSRFVAGGVDATLAAEPGPVFEPQAGMRIGRYLLRRKIASGGMGTVFEAEQENPSRVVAVKTLRVGISNDDARRRFRYEAEALGRLQHPNIAQVFEAGIHSADAQTAEGNGDTLGDCPYFAMELIANARSLTTYARERDLTIEARLRLFLAVADAVHYGHQRGVIHRDLKPGNILVDPRGIPKVIDYGLARVNADDWQKSKMTIAGEVVGTLLYMSPEQLRGDHDAIDVRSDVYSLGAVLHELLSGGPPYDLRDKTIVEALRILTTADPRLPSTVNPAVSRELDWIVSKALARECDRRYSSASELAADVTRFLDHEPLSAGPPSTFYQLRKFTRRHRIALATLISIFVALTGGVIVSLAAMRDAERARDAAAAEASRANESFAFVKSIFETARADTGRRESRVKDLLDSAAARIDAEFASQPLVEAAVRSMIGDCYVSIDDSRAAAPQLERAVAIRREHLGDAHVDTLRSRMGLGILRGRQGRRAEAEVELRAAADGLLRLEGANQVDAVVAIGNHAGALADIGRIAEAEVENRRAVALAAEHCPGSEQQALVESMLANTLSVAGKIDEAIELSRKALERCKLSTGGNEEFRLRVRLIASVRIAQLDPPAGAAELEDVYLAASRQLGPRHATTIQALLHRGSALLDAGDAPNAELCLRNAVAQQLEADGAEAWTTAACRRELAEFLDRTGRFEEGEQLLRDAIVDATQGLGENDPDVLSLRQLLVDGLADRGRFEEAEELQRRVLAAAKTSQGETGPQTVTAALSLGFILQQTSRVEEAVGLFESLAEACRRELGPGQEYTAIAFGNLGACRMFLRQYAEAATALETALTSRLESLGPDHHIVAAIAADLGVAKREIGDFKGSEAALRHSLAARLATLASADPQVRAVEIELSRTLRAAGRFGESAELIRGVLERAGPDDATATRPLLVELRAIYDAAGDTERVREIDSKLGTDLAPPSDDG